MKKTLCSIMAALIAASILISSCSGIDDTSTAAESETYTGNYGKYAQIGTDVYAALQKTFGSRENARAALDGDYDLEVADETTTPTIEELKESGVISALAASYIQRIEDAIDGELSANEVFDAIFAIEEEALEELAENDADVVMSYAETLKATFAYFENVSDTDNGDNFLSCARRATRDKAKDKKTKDKSNGSFRGKIGKCWEITKRISKSAARSACENFAKRTYVAVTVGLDSNTITRASIGALVSGAVFGAAKEAYFIYKERHSKDR